MVNLRLDIDLSFGGCALQIPTGPIEYRQPSKAVSINGLLTWTLPKKSGEEKTGPIKRYIFER